MTCSYLLIFHSTIQLVRMLIIKAKSFVFFFKFYVIIIDFAAILRIAKSFCIFKGLIVPSNVFFVRHTHTFVVFLFVCCIVSTNLTIVLSRKGKKMTYAVDILLVYSV
jgi:hypothetical protein